MKRFIIKAASLMLAASIGSAYAAGANQAFSPQEFDALYAKLPAATDNGAQVHAKRFCSGCHGAQGIAAMPNWPHVSGQPFEVTVKSLLDYREGKRAAGAAMMMAGAAKALTDQDIVDLAAYYEKISGPDGKMLVKSPVQTDAKILHLIAKGDASRAITPCAVCHGTTSKGNLNGKVPVLHGQSAVYLTATLKDYRSGVRSADMLKEMRFFAAKLKDEEIAALAAHYAQLTGKAVKTAESEKPAKTKKSK